MSELESGYGRSALKSLADIFSAITEDRPYRKGMNRHQAERVIRENVAQGTLIILDGCNCYSMNCPRLVMFHSQ